ncbi:tail fiber domain-containing protein [Herbiconiux sp. L3-i23]|uniref:tail fiber domain-containing protein n=1 Tax=Herbiconiux sp. L3-i23 TaxID=2905871 RepID=UPI00205E67F2|nr:tail fiber domain-containing protein [Herbiconiux sp. L3-i23]BDI23538.1 hypothetical protein L3i23_23140 [Herbiconiux sp. L3-i23]
MAGRSPAGDGLGWLQREIGETRRRLDELERPSGTSVASLYAQVQAALANITSTVQAAIAANSMTTAQIQALVASPGAISPASVNASGDVRVGGALRAPQVPVTILTQAYFATYATTVDGKLGHVPSSRRFKQDIAPASAPLDAVLALQLMTFRYIAAVDELGDDADVEWGLIAEDVHDLGLHWLVSYDADGLPVGVRFERLALALLPVIQDHETRIADLEQLLYGFRDEVQQRFGSDEEH